MQDSSVRCEKNTVRVFEALPQLCMVVDFTIEDYPNALLGAAAHRLVADGESRRWRGDETPAPNRGVIKDFCARVIGPRCGIVSRMRQPAQCRFAHLPLHIPTPQMPHMIRIRIWDSDFGYTTFQCSVLVLVFGLWSWSLVLVFGLCLGLWSVVLVFGLGLGTRSSSLYCLSISDLSLRSE